jgi:N-acetylglucosamine transport system permease protein
MNVKRKAFRTPWIFIMFCTLPALILTCYFLIWPTVQVFWLSLTNASILGYSNAQFIGLENYEYMLGDRRFMQAMQNTFKLLAVTPIITVFLSLVLAFMVTQSKLRERGFYRTIFFFPAIVSMTVIGIIWSFVFHPSMGILNSLLNAVGLGSLAQPWIGQSNTALWTIAVALIWQAAGYFMVMHIAAIDGIPTEIYEAATIDGAGPLRRLFNITLPLIKDIVGITFVFAVSGTLNHSFALATVMTAGGPNGASSVLLFYIYRQGIRDGNFGYSMAIAAFTLTIAVLLSLISRFISSGQER